LSMPALGGAILRQVDGVRTMGAIGAAVGHEGFVRAWAQVWAGLNGMNRLLLAPGQG